MLSELEHRLARTSERADDFDRRHQTSMRVVQSLKTGILSIFSRLGCASTSVEEMLGGQGVTETNMMQYLALIEQRASEILHTYSTSQSAAHHSGELGMP